MTPDDNCLGLGVEGLVTALSLARNATNLMPAAVLPCQPLTVTIQLHLGSKELHRTFSALWFKTKTVSLSGI